jgi:hypothetical protein
MKRMYRFIIALAITAGINLQVWAAQPTPQLDGSVYYYVAFVRISDSGNERGVLEDQGNGNQLKTAALDPGNPAQLWAITGGSNGSLVFTSKSGNKIVFEENAFKTSSSASGEGLTIQDCAAVNGTGTVYQIRKGADDADGNYMIPNGESGIGKFIAGYNKDNGGNALTFISEKAVPLVSPADHSADVWYYMYYPRNDRGYVKDNGAGEYLTHDDAVENSDVYLWRVISTGDGSGRFYIESKAGRRIGFSDAKYRALQPGENGTAFHFNGTSAAGSTYGVEDAHFPLLSDGSTMMNANGNNGNDFFEQYSRYDDVGQAVVFAPVSTYPKISSGNIKYWYRIGFSNRGDTHVIQDQGAGNALLQKAKATGTEAQYWTLNGADKSNFKVESKLGNQFANTSTKTAADDGGDSYSLAKSTHAAISGQTFNKGEGKIRWQLFRNAGTGNYYVNSNGGGGANNTSVAEWQNNNVHNSLNFEPVPAIYLTSGSGTLSFFGTQIDATTSSQTVTVEALGLNSDISYTVTDNDNNVFSVTPATGWNNREGGTLEITFTPKAYATYSSTLTITSTDAEINVEITLSGICTADPLIVTNPVTNSLDFGNVYFTKKAKPLPIHLIGSNLTAEVTYEIAGADASNFSVTPASPLTPTGGNLDVTLTIGFTAGNTEKDYAATLTISGGGTTGDLVINLTAKGVAPGSLPLPLDTYGYIQLVGSTPSAVVRYDFLEYKGEGTAVEMRPATAGVNGAGIDAQLWKIVDTETTNQYQIESKAGTKLDYVGSNFVASTTSTATFDFVQAGDKWTIKYNGADNAFISRVNNTESTYPAEDKLTASATGSDFRVHAAASIDFPKISDGSNEYWYKIRSKEKNTTLKDGGTGTKDAVGSGKVTHSAESNTTSELWKLIPGSKTGGYKLVTYAGNQMHAGINSTGSQGGGVTRYLRQQTVAPDGHDYALEKLGEGWALRNLDREDGATEVINGYYVVPNGDNLAQWSNNGTNEFVFTFEAPPAEFEVTGPELSFGIIPNNTTKDMSVTVAANYLTGTITWDLDGTDKSSFTVTPAAGWSGKTGGQLTVRFAPTTAGKIYSATLTIKGDNGQESVLNLSGEVSADPLIVIDPVISTLDFGNVEFGKKAKPLPIQLIGGNLTSAAVTYEITGVDASNFSVTPASPLTPESGSLDVALTIGFTAGNTEKNYAAMLTISGGGTNGSIVINLTAAGVAPNLPLPLGEYGYIQLVGSTPSAVVRYDFLEDKGNGNAVEMRPATAGVNGAGIDAQLWKIVDTEITNQYQIESKAGTKLDYVGSNFTASMTSTATFDFVPNGDKWKIKYNGADNAFISRINNGEVSYLAEDKLNASTAGSDFRVHAAASIVFPKISDGGNEYWYKIHNHNTHGYMLKNKGTGQQAQLGDEDHTTSEVWKLIPGTQTGSYRIVTYAGTQLAGNNATWVRNVTVVDGHDYALEKMGAGWALRNLVKRDANTTNGYYIMPAGNGTEVALWDKSDDSKYVFTFEEPVPQDFVIGATKSAAEYNPALHGDIIFQSDDNTATGQLTNIPPEGLAVNGAVKLKKTFTPKTWYPIGFPFDVASVSIDRNGDPNHEVEASTTGIDKDYWLKTYDNTSDRFEYNQAIVGKKGYIIQFPTDFNGKEVTFTSTGTPVLKNVAESGLTFTLTGSGYHLVANLSANNLTLNTADKYYIYNRDANNFDLLQSGNTAVIKPFEAFIVVHNVQGPLKSSLNIEEATALEPLNVIGGEAAVKIEYYTLQGLKVNQPHREGVYIVKKEYASGKSEVSKIIYKK